MEQYLDRQLSTAAVEATTWWEAGLAFVKLQDCGLEVHLPVKVCCYYTHVHTVQAIKHLACPHAL